jgi:Family of unknown function (DUF6527)
MPRQSQLTPEFIELAPSELKEGVLYISMLYGSAIHKCCCGCGEKVVTPLGPTDWKLTYDGEAISLYPSVGNWSFRCQSHYWIQDNQVRWAPRMSRDQINSLWAGERAVRDRYYSARQTQPAPAVSESKTRDFWSKVRALLRLD